MSRNTLLISDQILLDRTAIHGNLDPSLLRPDVKFAQDAFILPLIGSALMATLQDQIDAGNFRSAYKKLLDEYIIDALIYYTLMELPVPLSFQVNNKGIVRKQGDSTETPSMSDLVDISNGFRRKAEFYANRLSKFLQQNSLTYPEFYSPGNGIDTVRPDKKAFTSPIYLGDIEERCEDTWTVYGAGNTTIDQTTLNTTYIANGTEGNTITVPAIANKSVVLITRENAVLYQVATGPDTTEYVVSGVNIVLGAPTQANERFLILYK